MSRYEIREQEPSEVARSYGLNDTLFVVWDTAEDRKIPFGNYRTRAMAEARRARLEARETHAVRIERTRIDGEPVRRFHLLVEVTFADREAEPRDEHDRNYYRDHELSGVVTGWMRNALEDRDDSPEVRFTEMNHPNILNELRHGYDEIIKLKEMISKLTSLEQTPGSLNGNDARALLRIVWQWIIDANNGNGADSDDLIHELERAGYQCPAELENVMTPRLRALSPAVMERAVVVWGRELAKGLTPGGALVTVLSEVLPLHAHELAERLLRDAGATAIDSDFMAGWSESLTNAYWSAVNAPTNPEAADKTLALLNAYAHELAERLLRDAGEWDGWPEKQAARVYAAGLIRPGEEA